MAAIGKNPGRLADRVAAHVRDPEILAALRRVPRRDFLDPEMTLRADDDNALPIGFGQTTSQPSVIAKMLEMMSPPPPPPAAQFPKTKPLGPGGAGGRKFGRVLEVGAGCGYQTALLSELAREVCAVERVPELARSARARLRKMRYNNAVVIQGDGSTGWAERAPYDGAIVCAEGPRAPAPLLAQLAPAGRLVMPLLEGPVARLVAMNPAGEIVERGPRVAFVPLLEGAA